MSIEPKGKLEWEDIRSFVDFAWKSFVVKVTVFWAIVSAAATVLAFVFEKSIPEIWKNLLIYGFATVLVVAVIATAVRGLAGLLLDRKRLIEDNAKAWASVQSLNAEKQALTTKPQSHRAAWSSNAQLYGLCFYNYTVETTLGHDGSFKTHYALDFGVTHEGIDAIERRSWATQAAVTDVATLDAPQTRCGGILLLPGPVQASAFEQLWTIKMVPAPRIGNRLQYAYSESFPPRSMAMTKPEMEGNGLRWEYYCVTMAHPTEKLRTVVNLPNGFIPTRNTFDVWYTWRTQVKHDTECQRLVESESWKPEWLNDHYVLRLEVDHPIQGLTYAIKWHPPVIWEPQSS